MVALLRACYGDTYSHRGLYEPGAFCSLWQSRRLASLGWFEEDGSLRGHTGFFWKDSLGDFVESGLSIVTPGARRGRQRTQEAALWDWIRQSLSGSANFLHQHTTTLHPGAQLYAVRHMKARHCGLIPDYVRGERLIALNERGDTMHALVLTTFLAPLSPEKQTILLPAGPHTEWLQALAQSLGLCAQVVPRSAVAPADLTEIERTEVFGLIRRRAQVTDKQSGAPIGPASARVDLVHLPAQEAELACLSDSLYAAGYLPVGLRLGCFRPHEIIWWRGEPPIRLLEQMTLAEPRWEESLRAWCRLTVHRR